jgi:hypothetical protein
VTVTFLGSSQSRIVDVQSDSNYIQTDLQPLQRPESADVGYQLTASIRPDAPVGKWYTDVWVRTTSPDMPRVRVPLTVEIESALSVSPAAVTLGQVKVGDQAQRRVIVRGVQPFRITAVKGMDEQVTVQNSSTEKKPVHVLTVTLKGVKAGEVHHSLQIVTDMKEEGEIELKTSGQVLP